MIKEEDWVLFQDMKGKEWLRQISLEGFLDTHKGKIFFSDILGKDYGSIVPYSKGSGKIILLEPNLENIQQYMPHATNIIYNMDASLLCFKANIKRGNKVLEIGTGSGGLTLYIATFLYEYPDSNKMNDRKFPIITVDSKSDHQNIAKKNLKKFKLDHMVDFRLGDFDEINPLLDLPEQYFDAIFIDLATPWLIINKIHEYLKYGKSVVIFVPNWGQIEKTVIEAEINHNYKVLEVLEIFSRPMIIDGIRHVTRPLTRAIAYSGVIIHLIRKKEYQDEK